MKDQTLQVGLILLALFVIGATLYVMPLTLNLFPTISYKFVLVFILAVIASNLLAKITTKFLTI